jgi:hypothetical protein
MDLYVNLSHNLQLVESSHYLVEVDICYVVVCMDLCKSCLRLCTLFGFVLFLSVSLMSRRFFCYFYKINVRENRRGNQDCTIQRYRQHCPQKTQNENKNMSIRNPPKTGLNPYNIMWQSLSVTRDMSVVFSGYCGL